MKTTHRSSALTLLTVILIILFFVAIGIGFHKMLVYEYSEIFKSENVNVYVGGDAYNYIINAEKTVAWFVFGFGSLLAAILLELVNTCKARAMAAQESAERIERTIKESFQGGNPAPLSMPIGTAPPNM